VDVEKRLLKMTDSFAEHASKEELDAFTAQVLDRLGLTVPSKTGTPGGAGPTGVGPSGGGLREGRDTGRLVGERTETKMFDCRS
jgi:hypothetical protein